MYNNLTCPLYDIKSLKVNINLNLTPREKEVLTEVAKGKSNVEIANTLFISRDTAKMHLVNIFQKLNVCDRTEAVVKALKYNIIQNPL